ncbi:MAG: hypothetical protein V3U87_14880 [Methylococcaceae bacterium]
MNINTFFTWYENLSVEWQTTLFSVILIPILIWLKKIVFSPNRNKIPTNSNKITTNNRLIFIDKLDSLLESVNDLIRANENKQYDKLAGLVGSFERINIDIDNFLIKNKMYSLKPFEKEIDKLTKEVSYIIPK